MAGLSAMAVLSEALELLTRNAGVSRPTSLAARQTRSLLISHRDGEPRVGTAFSIMKWRYSERRNSSPAIFFRRYAVNRGCSLKSISWNWLHSQFRPLRYQTASISDR